MKLPTHPPRFIRREVHRPETQELIYQAAVRLFRERGYHATSVRDIAAAVGIQPATIYHYFGGKEALLFTIMERVLLHLLEEQKVAVRISDNPVEQLAEMVRVHVRIHCERPLEAFIGDYELRALSGDLYAQILAYRDQYQATFRQVIEEGVRQGVFSVPDIRVTTNILLVMATASVSWFHPDGRLPLEEIADIHAKLALKMVMPYPPLHH
jgi:AcrR family transcriptional regulator